MNFTLPEYLASLVMTVVCIFGFLFLLVMLTSGYTWGLACILAGIGAIWFAYMTYKTAKRI